MLLVVLLALAGYVYFIEVPQEQEAANKKKLFVVDKEAVTEVALMYPDHAITLKKNEDGKWRITQPVAADADESTVKNLLNAVADAEVKRTLDATPQDLAVYGLTAPIVRFKLTLKDGKALPLVSMGKDTPVGFSVYVQKEGDGKILLLPQTLRSGMIKEVKDLRDRTVLTFTDEAVKTVEIRGPDKEIVLSKADSGWRLEKPASAKADDTEVGTFLANLHSLRAQDFLEDPLLELKNFGLDPPQLSIVLTLGSDGTQKTILLGGEKKDEKGGTTRYLKRAELEKPLFLVGDWVLRDLSKTATDFREKTVAQFDQERARKVEMKRQDGEDFTLTRQADNQWSIDKTQDGTLREPALSQFIADLRELRGFEVVAENPKDLRPYGLDKPTFAVTVSDEEGKSLATIRAGQKTEGEGKKSFAMAEGSPTVFGLRDYVFDRLNKKPTDFWEKPGRKEEAPASPPPPLSENSEEETKE